jgi:hypothetical protein
VIKKRVSLFLLLFITSLPGIKSSGQIIDSVSVIMTPRLSFYSGEKTAEFILKLPATLIHKQLNIKLFNSGNVINKIEQRIDRETFIMPVDLTSFPSTATIEAEISIVNQAPESTVVRYLTSCILTLLPHKANEVKTDRVTGGLIVNNRQFFPFGFYCYSPVYPTLPEEEAVRGFNMISPYQKILPGTLNERKAYMDRCAQLGMKVHYNLLSVCGGGGVGSRVEGLSDFQKRDLLIKEIKTFMDHPALLAWYISDEPTGNSVSPETLEEIYRVVKQTDPWHPVSIVFMAPYLSAKRYADAVDIVMADPYPVPDLPVSMVGEVTANLKKEFRFKKPVWIVPQAFGGGEHWSREPSIQEIRSMTYQSIINGATGIQYFVRQGLNSFPKSVSTWNECGRMAMEIAELTPWLLSAEEANPVFSFSKQIDVTSKIHDGQLAVLAVNKMNEPRTAEIRVSGIETGNARVIFENRKVNFNQGVITDMLPPFGSQVYMIDLKKVKNEYAPWPGNLIVDSGFEDISSIGIPAACYARPGRDRGATYFVDSGEHLEGNHSLRLITPRDSNGVAIRFFPVTMTTGSSYILSIWAKADPERRLPLTLLPGKSSAVKNNELIPQSVEISVGEFCKSSFVPRGDWKQYIKIITIPADTVKRIKTNVILRMPGQGVAWFDMLQLIEDPLKR